MIEIRPDQIQMFLDRVRTTFAARTAAYLKANRRDWVKGLNASALEALIRRQIAAADRYGIQMEAAVVQFVEIGLAFGEDFHSSGRYPEAERILLQGVDAAVKMQELQSAAAQGFEPAKR